MPEVPVSPNDRKIMDALLIAINDPATSEEARSEYREEFGLISMGYLDLFTSDEERREYEERSAAERAKNPPDARH
jgi:hypothetical protein